MGHLASLFLGQKARPVVVLDTDQAGRNRKNSLMKELYAGYDSSIIMLDEVIGRPGDEIEIEDIIGEEIVIAGVSRILGTPFELSDQNQSLGGVVNRIQATAEKQGVDLGEAWKARASLELVGTWAENKTTLPAELLDYRGKALSLYQQGVLRTGRKSTAEYQINKGADSRDHRDTSDPARAQRPGEGTDHALGPQPRLNLSVEGVEAGALVRRVRTAIDEHDWIVIDCPPGITRVNADAIRVADVVLIPCKPRVWDAWACEDIVAAVKLRQDANRGWPKAAFIITMGRPERVSASRLVQPWLNWGCPYISRVAPGRGYPYQLGPSEEDRPRTEDDPTP